MTILELKQEGCKLLYRDEIGWKEFADLTVCLAQSPDIQANTDEQYCSIANYVVEWLDAKFDDTVNTIYTETNVLSAVADVAEILPKVGAVFAALAEFVQDVYAAIAAGAQAAVTAQVKQEATRKLYCLLRAYPNK